MAVINCFVRVKLFGGFTGGMAHLQDREWIKKVESVYVTDFDGCNGEVQGRPISHWNKGDVTVKGNRVTVTSVYADVKASWVVGAYEDDIQHTLNAWCRKCDDIIYGGKVDIGE